MQQTGISTTFNINTIGNTMKKIIITLCSLSFILVSAQGQLGGGPGGPPEGPGGPPDRPEVNPNIPEDVLAMRDEVRAMRETLMAERDALIESLGEDATREEIVAALAEWEAENSAALDEMRGRSDELRDAIRENRPAGIGGGPPEEVLAMRDELVSQRQALAESRREAILALGENPTDEQVRDAIEAWRAENADALEDVEGLAQQLRDSFRANRPGQAGPPDNPGLSQRRAEFRENAQAIRQNRQALRTQLRDPELGPDERKAIVEQFRDEQRTIMQERKELRRQERLDQDVEGGDSRPGG